MGNTERHDDCEHTGTSASLAGKYNNTVLIFGPSGIDAREYPDNGLVVDDTRFVSSFTVNVDEHEGTLLQAEVSGDGTLLTTRHGFGDKVEATRSVLVSDRKVFEELKFRNEGIDPVSLPVKVTYSSDFASIFEMRGDKRKSHGHIADTKTSRQQTVIEYAGLDNRFRKAVFAFSLVPDLGPEMNGDGAITAKFFMAVPPGGEQTIYFRYGDGEHELDLPSAKSFEEERKRVIEWTSKIRNEGARIEADNDTLNEWLKTSRNDLDMLMMETSLGYYPAAGIPWYATQFGRDGIITAMEALTLNPAIAKGVLGFLAGNQADFTDRTTSAEPGKIIHEMRRDEMSMTGEKPFRKYYGGADTTLLFVMLAGAYLERTGDKDFIESIYPNIEKSLGWMQDNIARTGFVNYKYDSEGGLLTQFWKDSDGSVVHLDNDWGDRDLPDDFDISGDFDSVLGALNQKLVETHGFQGQKIRPHHFTRLGVAGEDEWGKLSQEHRFEKARQVFRIKLMPKDPVAPASLQGYAYDALNAAAKVKEALGLDGSEECRKQAKELQQRFEQVFWMPDQETYAMALDGDNRPCRVKASDLGHLLFSGIVPEEKAGKIVEHLTGPDMFSGHGIRTMADGQEVAGFGYQSYHNGSVWPHDTAVCAAGMARYGYYDEAASIMKAICEAAWFTEGRLDELFSGAAAVEGEPPEKYHAACAPQAWAAGAAFMLVQSALGLTLENDDKLTVAAREIPEMLDGIKITGLKTQSGERDFVITRDLQGSPVVKVVAQNWSSPHHANDQGPSV